MAFVFRSERNPPYSNNTVGPGEYDEEFTKTQGRLLHKNNIKYSTIIKNPNQINEIPFNTTSQRSKLFEGDDLPGPGSYEANTVTENFKSSFNQTSTNSSNDKESKLMQIENLLSMNNKSVSKGFLSSVNRFNKSISNNELNPGPGTYEIKSIFNLNPTNYNNNKGKIKRGTLMPTSNSIPDKTKGEFTIIDGVLSEVKKEKIKGDIVGPGRYNLRSNWDGKCVTWDKKGFSKNKKNKYNENDIQKELEKNSSIYTNCNYTEKMHNYNMSNTSTTFPYAQKSNHMSSLLTNSNNNNTSSYFNTNSSNFGNNMTNSNSYIQNIGLIKRLDKEKQPRNFIFHDFIKSREDLHNRTMSKLKDSKNVIIDLQYKELPGPGFYDQKIIPNKHSFYSFTSQNFGSNSPKFFNITEVNEFLGPGSYFKEKNKYEPKFETVLHARIPEKQKRKNNNSVFVKNLIKKNIEKQPGPGQYNIEGKFIKKEISNIRSFGSNVERFKRAKSKEEDDENNKKKINYENYNNNIQSYQKNNSEDKKYKNKIKELELLKEKEKRKRKKYIEKRSPPVGAYSPEVTNSISYQVLSKLNPYRNKLAPFNVINSRFGKGKNLKTEESPGPADYNVSSAFDSLNLNTKKKFNVFGKDKQRKVIARNNCVPGPGGYNLDNPDDWNKKTYNILFINNNY